MNIAQTNEKKIDLSMKADPNLYNILIKQGLTPKLIYLDPKYYYVRMESFNQNIGHIFLKNKVNSTLTVSAVYTRMFILPIDSKSHPSLLRKKTQLFS
jgi:hypothetical protein